MYKLLFQTIVNDAKIKISINSLLDTLYMFNTLVFIYTQKDSDFIQEIISEITVYIFNVIKIFCFL